MRTTRCLEAWRFDWVLANHDGEDSENWTMEWPVGDAWATVRAFAELLETGATARGAVGGGGDGRGLSRRK